MFLKATFIFCIQVSISQGIFPIVFINVTHTSPMHTFYSPLFLLHMTHYNMTCHQTLHMTRLPPIFIFLHEIPTMHSYMILKHLFFLIIPKLRPQGLLILSRPIHKGYLYETPLHLLLTLSNISSSPPCITITSRISQV